MSVVRAVIARLPEEAGRPPTLHTRRRLTTITDLAFRSVPHATTDAKTSASFTFDHLVHGIIAAERRTAS